MTWQSLDKAIDDLESLVDYPGFMTLEEKIQRISQTCEQIQEGFNSKPYYPTKQQRDAAWERFNTLRSRGFNVRREYKAEISQKIRNELFHDLRLADTTLVTLSPRTAF
jgi:hypothetical protein